MTAEVLARLDALAEAFSFPGFDNAHYVTVDSRLHAFVAEERWTLVVEELVHWPAADGIMRMATVIGPATDELLTNAAVEPATWLDDDAEEVQPDSVELRGRRIELDWDAIEALVGEEDIDPEAAGLVWLVASHREELFATKAEMGEWVEAGAKRVLTVDEWRHPNIYGEEAPSTAEAFQQIALVLTSGDPTHWKPTEPPNNRDWRYWLDER